MNVINIQNWCPSSKYEGKRNKTKNIQYTYVSTLIWRIIDETQRLNEKNIVYDEICNFTIHLIVKNNFIAMFLHKRV